MARISDQFQQSDVTVWGIAALVSVAIAVVGANVAALLPSSALIALHSPQNEAISMAQLRQQVMELRTETAQLRRQNEVLTTRFSLQEQTGNEVIRRVGALEVSMPTLAEIRPMATPIDRTVTTASIGVNAAQQFEADGGTVVVRQSPMQQPLPAPIQTASASSGADVGYAVAVGANFPAGQARAQWHDLEIRLGSMFGGMNPLIIEGTGPDQQRIVVGPIAQLAQARDLCMRLEQMEISCAPASYSGTALSQ